MKPSSAKRTSDAPETPASRRGARAAIAAVIGVPMILFILIELPFILEGFYGLSANATRAIMWIAAAVVAILCLWLVFRPEGSHEQGGKRTR